MPRACYENGCQKPAKTRGLCGSHYQRALKTGAISRVRSREPSACSHAGCGRISKARGYCSTHYRQFRQYGKTFNVGDLYHQPKGGLEEESIEAFFWARVSKSSGCWPWTGVVTKGRCSYGYSTRAGYKMVAHRLSYILNVGPIPEGMQVDHRCHNKRCVKPSHLRLATPSQNSQNFAHARVDSTTGIRGVTRNGKRFGAQVAANGVRHWLGTYDTAEEAGEAARLGRLRYHVYNDSDRRDLSA